MEAAAGLGCKETESRGRWLLLIQEVEFWEPCTRLPVRLLPLTPSMGIHEATQRSQEEGNGSASTRSPSVVALYSGCWSWVVRWDEEVRRGLLEVGLLQELRGGSVSSGEVCNRSASFFLESEVTLTASSSSSSSSHCKTQLLADKSCLTWS